MVINVFNLINFKDCEILYRETTASHKEDLLQLKCKNGRLIDVGWYGPENGYCIYVIENDDWSHPCYKIAQQPKLQFIEQHLQKVIDFECSAFTPAIQEIFTQITLLIDNATTVNASISKAVDLLEQLRVMGLQQREVANYIEIYAMKYQDECEEKWDMACDMLDIITGWCSPEQHIWKDE